MTGRNPRVIMKATCRLRQAQKLGWGVQKTFEIHFINKTAEILCYATYGRGMGSKVTVLRDQYVVTELWLSETIEEFKQAMKQCVSQSECSETVRGFLDFMRKKDVGVKVTQDV